MQNFAKEFCAIIWKCIEIHNGGQAMVPLHEADGSYDESSKLKHWENPDPLGIMICHSSSYWFRIFIFGFRSLL